MIDTPHRCQARPTAPPIDAGYCPESAEWTVDVAIRDTALAFSLSLCRAHLDAVFEVVPGALSTMLPTTTLVDTLGTENALMFPVTKCQTNFGCVPAHVHGDEENWVLAELVEEVVGGHGIYRAGDGSLHLLRTADGIRLQRLTPVPAR